LAKEEEQDPPYIPAGPLRGTSPTYANINPHTQAGPREADPAQRQLLLDAATWRIG